MRRKRNNRRVLRESRLATFNLKFAGMKHVINRLACALLVVVTAASAQAQKQSASGSELPGDSAAIARSINRALRTRLTEFESLSLTAPQSGDATQDKLQPSAPSVLTLDEVLNMVELYHPKLRGADAQRQIASAKRLEKQGAFDPVFMTGADFLRFNTEFDSKLKRGKVGTAELADAGVEFLTRSGLKIGAGTRFNLGKVKAPLSPTGNAGEYFLEFKLPLLRGWRINEKSAAERQAILGEPLADTEFQAARLELLLKASTAYWDWVAAKQKLEVARNLLSLAEFRVRAVRDRVAAGDLPQIDATEADLEVQRRQGGVVKADRELQKAAFKLSLYLWSPNGLPAPVPQEANAPRSTAPPVNYDQDKIESGTRLAAERRPELKAIAINQQIAQVDLDLGKNQRRPALDLAFSPGRDIGTGGIGNTVKAGVSFTLPLRQRTADGRIAAANLKLQKLDLDLTNERQRIMTEVLDTVSAINTAYNLYLVALQEVNLAQQLEQGERAKFALGDSTLFLVNQRERVSAEARIKLIEMQMEYEQAVATFRTVTVQY